MSLESPTREHTCDIKQEKLDDLTTRAILKCGGGNNAQARYFQSLSEVVVGSELPVFECLQPHMSITDSKPWQQAICLVNAYLKRHRMDYTLKTVRTEYSENPRSTGYKSAKVVDQTLRNLISLSRDLSALDFEERAAEFTDDLKQRVKFPNVSPKRPRSPRKSPK